MNSEKTKLKFGVSRTRYSNMAKAGLLPVNEENIAQYKAIVKKRRKGIEEIQRKKHELAKAGRKAKTKK
jgi:hypothetical protein